jgi:hypothetical protein
MSNLSDDSDVRVTYGAHSIKANMAGLSVAQVHLCYSPIFIDPCSAKYLTH